MTERIVAHTKIAAENRPRSGRVVAAIGEGCPAEHRQNGKRFHAFSQSTAFM